jgi:hypothetical protein
MKSSLFLSCVLFLSACGALGTGEVPEQLESIESLAQSDNNDLAIDSDVDTSGELAVTGQDRELGLILSGDDGDLSIELHTPGSLDLSFLDGEMTRLVLSPSGLHGERNLALYDDQGVAYLAIGSYNWDLADEAFGAGFVDFGSVVATDRGDGYDWTYNTVAFQTDDGAVEVGAGERTTILLDGERWEVVVVSAYQVEARPRAMLPCGGISDMLSFEMVRVTEDADEGMIQRPDGSKMAHLGCL